MHYRINKENGIPKIPRKLESGNGKPVEKFKTNVITRLSLPQPNLPLLTIKGLGTEVKDRCKHLQEELVEARDKVLDIQNELGQWMNIGRALNLEGFLPVDTSPKE